ALAISLDHAFVRGVASGRQAVRAGAASERQRSREGRISEDSVSQTPLKFLRPASGQCAGENAPGDQEQGKRGLRGGHSENSPRVGAKVLPPLQKRQPVSPGNESRSWRAEELIWRTDSSMRRVVTETRWLGRDAHRGRHGPQSRAPRLRRRVLP